jgi:hypothetical protein
METQARVFEMLKKGGGTFKNGKPIQYNYGFQVALKQHDKHIYTVYEIEKIAELIDSRSYADCGIWLNNKTGLVEVDSVTVHITDIVQAFRIARDNDQLAIFDWDRMDSIDL